MTHLLEEDLILQLYGEHPDAARVASHLAACPECRAADAALRSDLQEIRIDVPPRGEDYGRRVWERLEPALVRRAQGRPSAVLRGPWVRRGAALLALAASLIVAFLVGRSTRLEPGPQALTATTRERILLVAVGDHLERSRTILLELTHADPEHPFDVSSRRVRAEQLLAASRLYRQSAVRAGEPGIASVLDEVERILVEVAHAPETLSPPEVREMGERINDRGLLFKVQVLGSQVKEREMDRRAPSPSPGSMS